MDTQRRPNRRRHIRRPGKSRITIKRSVKLPTLAVYIDISHRKKIASLFAAGKP